MLGEADSKGPRGPLPSQERGVRLPRGRQGLRRRTWVGTTRGQVTVPIKAAGPTASPGERARRGPYRGQLPGRPQACSEAVCRGLALPPT